MNLCFAYLLGDDSPVGKEDVSRAAAYTEDPGWSLLPGCQGSRLGCRKIRIPNGVMKVDLIPIAHLAITNGVSGNLANWALPASLKHLEA